MEFSAFPARASSTAYPTIPAGETRCRKAVIMTVALIAITALTLALLSHFGCIAAGSIGTICLFTTTGIAALGLASLLARCQTDPSAELGRPSEPNRNYTLTITRNEAIFTDQESGARFRRPIINLGMEEYLYIPFPASWGEEPDILQTYALARIPDGSVWALYHDLSNYTLVNKASPNQPLNAPGYDNLSAEQKVDPWSVHPNAREVQVMSRHHLSWELPDGKKTDRIPSKIYWPNNTDFNFQYAELSIGPSEDYIAILGAIGTTPPSLTIRLQDAFRLQTGIFCRGNTEDLESGSVVVSRQGNDYIGFYRFRKYCAPQWEEVTWAVAQSAQRDGMHVTKLLI